MTKNAREPSLEEQAFVVLQRAADRLGARVAEFLKAYELSPTQYNCLRILRGAGADGLPCSEVAARMINRDPDITRLVERLRACGLVTRTRDRSDRRVVRARITASGLRLLDEIDEPIREFHRKMLGGMGEKRVRELIGLLEGVS
jgi:DNA-binding MarR family transcriptional regulator